MKLNLAEELLLLGLCDKKERSSCLRVRRSPTSLAARCSWSLHRLLCQGP